MLIGPGLPGGMMGSLMADLENNLLSLNKWLTKNNQPEMNKDQLLIKLFDEVQYAWPKLGYPPLVTPFSQYVKNAALMNAIQVIKGKERWTMLDENTWGMILGNSGSLPGPVHNEIKQLAESHGREFFEGNPQDLYPDALDEYRAKMKEKQGDLGEDEEELFEFAMHPNQYEAFKDGSAKEKFLKDLAAKKTEVGGFSSSSVTSIQPTLPSQPSEMQIEVNGESYHIKVSYPSNSEKEHAGKPSENIATNGSVATMNGTAHYITSPLEGKFFLTKNSGEKGLKIGDKVTAGETVAYIESMKVINAITTDKSGTVADILVKHGAEVEEDDKIIVLN